MGLADVVREHRRVAERSAVEARADHYVEAESVSPLVTGIAEWYLGTKETHITKDTWFSPSMISDGCSRAYALAGRMNVPLIKARKFIPDLGTACHTMLQNEVLGPMGVLYGGWKCSDCGSEYGIDATDVAEIWTHGSRAQRKVTVKSAMAMPKQCDECGMKRGWRHGFEFIEVSVYDLALRFAGWSDGILRRSDGSGEPEIIDIKSTSAKGLKWHRDKGVEPSHATQTMWYMDLTGLKKGRVLYVDRGAKDVLDGMLECPVYYDSKVIKAQREKIIAIREAIEGKREIPACEYGGRRPWGPCECAGFDRSW